jgi:hypothetical protein
MREVEVTRFVQASPPIVDRLLSPEDILEAEGSFQIREVAEAGDEDASYTRVIVGGYGIELVFEFEERESGIEYRQVEGPLQTLRTTITYAPEDEGTRIAARSDVTVGGPSILDRVGGWKRRGELRRALDTLVADLRD